MRRLPWCIVFPSSGISAIFCMGFAYHFKAAIVFVKKKCMTYVGDFLSLVSWCIVCPSSGSSAIFCVAFAYLFKAAAVFAATQTSPTEPPQNTLSHPG